MLLSHTAIIQIRLIWLIAITGVQIIFLTAFREIKSFRFGFNALTRKLNLKPQLEKGLKI